LAKKGRTEFKVHSQTVDEVTAAAAGIGHGICHKILSDNLNMSHVTQHRVSHVLTQDQRDDRW
jgi:hypothetical protein